MGSGPAQGHSVPQVSTDRDLPVLGGCSAPKGSLGLAGDASAGWDLLPSAGKVSDLCRQTHFTGAILHYGQSSVKNNNRFQFLHGKTIPSIPINVNPEQEQNSVGII